MTRTTALRLTGLAFYALVAVWVLGILLGHLFGLPYVGRMYGGVTLPTWLGVITAALTLGDLRSGAIWRGRSTRTHDRDDEPRAYWSIICVQTAVAIGLLGLGIRNWLALPG